MYFDLPRKRLSKIILPAHKKALSQNCMYFTFLADNSVTPANIDGPRLEYMGQTGVWRQYAFFLRWYFPLWVSFQYHLLVLF